MPVFQQGLRRQEGMYYVKATEGLDSLRTDLTIGAKADIAQNLRFSNEVGAVNKRAAVSYFNSTEELAHPTSIYRYYREGNNTAYLIGLFGSLLRVSESGTFSTLTSNLLANSSGRKFTAVTYNDLAIISTGYDNIVQTDGTVAWELGSCKAELTLSSATNALSTGKYYYAVTFVTGLTETINGAISNTVTTDATHTSITLSYIPLGPDGTTARNIYRTTAGGTTLKLLTVIGDNSTQEYVDIIPDSSIIEAVTYVPAGTPGLDDASSSGTYSGAASAVYTITISTADTTDKFTWNKDGGAESGEVTMDGSAQTLSDGVKITFAATTGHTLADAWTINVIKGLGADMGAVNSDMPRGLYLYIAEERLFVANDVTDGVGRKSTVYYSDQYIPHYLFTETADMTTTQAANNYEVIRPDDNDVITGIINQLGVTYIFKQNSIIPWDVSGVPEQWVVGQAVSIIGCPAPYTIQASPAGIIYQGWDRMYIFNGQMSTYIIDDFTFDENFLDSSRADNVGYFWNNLYLLAYADANEAKSFCNRILVYDIIRKQSSIDKGGPLAVSTMNVGCFTSFKGSNEWGTLYAGDSQLGWVYQYDRTISSNQVNTQSAFNLGTYNGTYAAPPEDNTNLGGVVLDNMEAYSTNSLAQAAWVTSTVTASTKVPPYLGTGIDGIVTISVDTTITSGNYAELTIDAGKTLTASGNLYVVGTLTINGTLSAASNLNVYATNITVGATGVLANAGNMVFKANTITKTAGATIESILGTAAIDSDSASGSSATTRSCASATSADFAVSSTITKITYAGNCYSSSDDYSSVYNKSVSCSVEIYSEGVWVVVDSDGRSTSGTSASITASISGTSTTVYPNCISIRGTASASAYSDHDQLVTSSIGAIVAYGAPAMYYITGVGTGLPTSGDVTDYVAPLQVYSNTTIVNQGTYSLQVVCTPGTPTDEATISKTLPQGFNLAANDTILIDVWSLRSGTNVQLGMSNGSPVTYYVDIPVVTAQTWTTYELDFSGLDPFKGNITYLAMKFKDTATGNILYVDNIRPSSYSATPISYLSSMFTINAQSMGTMYWNAVLTSAGTVKVYTRTGDELTDYTSWTDDTGWSAALTNPAGSEITSFAKKYFQFKVTFESTDTTGKLFPYIYKANGYNIKFTYWKVQATAETSVEFIYRTGWRNFDQPFDDKIYRKLITLHEGSEGYFDARLECGEQDTQKFAFGSPPDVSWNFLAPISLVTYPARWYTTLPDNMYGKELRLTIYKNDNYSYRLRQYALMLETIGLI